MLIVDPAAADRVDDELDADAAPRRLFERLRELLGHVAGFEDVGLEADPALRAANGSQHRGEDLVAVGEDA